MRVNTKHPILLFDRLKITLWLVSILLVSSAIVLFGFMSAIPQDPAYHGFAPTTFEASEIPNTFNVITNIPFAIVGLGGLIYCVTFPQRYAPWSWPLFFTGVALTSVGSAFYHWDPNNISLVWDRIPMTIAFTGLFVALISEQINPKLENFLLAPLVIAGISSVVYWYYTDDLRAYGIVQFFPLVVLPLVVTIMPERYNSENYLFYALSFYIAAKIFEALDYETWNVIGFSGHAVKHLLAACSPFCILCMLKKRQPIRMRSQHPSEY